MKVRAILTAVAISTCLSNVAVSASKGQPFIEINGEIKTIQGDVSYIETDLTDVLSRLDSLEEKVLTIENKIIELDAKDVELQSKINDVMTLAEQNNINIQTLIEQDGIIQGQIDALRIDTDANGQLSKENIDQILILEEQLRINSGKISENVTGLKSLLAEQEAISGLINRMNEKIVLLEAKLNGKQSVLINSCDGTLAIKNILADGSVQCIDIDEPENSLLATAQVSKTFTTKARTTQQVWKCSLEVWGVCLNWVRDTAYGAVVDATYTTYCPVGSVRMGSYVAPTNLAVSNQYPTGSRGWTVVTYNSHPSIQNITVRNTCLSINN